MNQSIKFFGVFFASLILILISNSTAVFAQERLFLDLNIEFLGEYQLTENSFQDTKLGGFSGITYDRRQDLFYLISDDRSSFAPARFYTLKIDINNEKINDIEIEKVTFLKNEQGENYPRNSLDTEAIAFSPRNTLFISSEGVANQEIPPFIKEFDLAGNLLKTVKIPQRYLPNNSEEIGIENNLAFESLTIKSNGFMNQEPFRLFTVTESALKQDIAKDNPQTYNRNRFLHYVVNPFGEPVIIAEHLYQMDAPPFGTLYHGVSDLLTLPQEGYLLSIERTFGLRGFGVKIFQIVMTNANDISSQKTLSGNIDNVNAIDKKLLLDLSELNIELDNIEGITFGPSFLDGSQSLILISDNNFTDPGQQKNQFLLFKLTN